MVDYVKKWIGFKKKDDEKEIPQMHLPPKKNFYYDEKLKKWVIEGEEQKEDNKPKLPPPKLNTNKQNTKKQLKGSSRYANVLGSDSIYTPETPIESKTEEKDVVEKIENKFNESKNENIINNIENKNTIFETPKKEEMVENKENKEKEEEKEEKKEVKGKEEEEKDEYQLSTNNMANNFYSNNIKSLNSLKKFDGKSEISEISHKEDLASVYPNELNDYRKNILEEEIIKIKEEYNQNLKQKEIEYETQINELKEIHQFNEETYNETTSVLKNQINNFIKENLELKSKTEKLNDEIEYHKKEVNEYKNLFEHYKKLVEENNNKIQNGGNDQGNSSEANQNIISSVIVEKLESEKMILNNDIIELKNQNESYKKEKEFYIVKNKKLEEENEENKNTIIKLEKSLDELKVNNNLMNHKKEKMEKNIERLNKKLKGSEDKIMDQQKAIVILEKYRKIE